LKDGGEYTLFVISGKVLIGDIIGFLAENCKYLATILNRE